MQETSLCFKDTIELKFENYSGVWNSLGFGCFIFSSLNIALNIAFLFFFFFFSILFIIPKDCIQKKFGEQLKETPTQGRKNPQLVLILAFSHVAAK